MTLLEDIKEQSKEMLLKGIQPIALVASTKKKEELDEELKSEAWTGTTTELPAVNAPSVIQIKTERYDLVILPIASVDETFFMVLGR